MAKETKKEKEVDFFKDLKEKYNAYFEPEKIKTGILPLDLVLNGSLQTGSLIELAGESQSGKSTLVLNLAKNLAEKGYKTLYIDAEGSVKDDMIKGIGLEPYVITEKKQNNKFIRVCEARYSVVEQIINGALTTGEFKLIVIDSLTALGNDDYINIDSGKDAVDTRIGMDAQLNSRFLKKLSALKTTYNCIFIVINQTRVDLSRTFMPTHESTGGQATKFYPDIRLFMKVIGKIEEEMELIVGTKKVPIGAKCEIIAKKSRVGAGFIPFPLTIYYGKGVYNADTYFVLLQTISAGKTKVLESVTNKTYLLHLPSDTYKTTNGEKGAVNLILEHYAEVEKVASEFLDDYFKKVENNELKTGKETFTSVDHDINIDDTIEVAEYDI